MKRAILALGGARLECDVCETAAEHVLGLQGHDFLLDWQGMYFPMSPPGRAVFAMASVMFPIDILFFRDARLVKIISNVPPGHPGRWDCESCSGTLEVRGGWAVDHLIRVGMPLFGSI